MRRLPDPDDRRRVVVEATDEGVALAKQVNAELHRWEDSLATDDREHDELAATLAGIGGISSAALTSTNGAPMPGGIWTDGGSARRKGYRGTGHRRSPADRIAAMAIAKRMSNGD